MAQRDLSAAGWLCGLAALTLAPPAALAQAGAAAPVAYEVVAAFEDSERTALQVEVTITLEAAVPGETLRLWWPVTRLSRVPRAVDERSWRWVFPYEADLVTPTLDGVWIDGSSAADRATVVPIADAEDVAGSDIVIEVPRGSTPRTLRVRTRVPIPKRFGRIGRHGDARYLLAPWYPVVVDPDGHHRFNAVHRVRIDGPGRFEVLVAGARRRPGEQAVVRGSFAPVAVAPRFHRRVRSIDDGTNASLRITSAEPFYDPPPPDAEGIDALEDVVAIDRVGLLASAAGGVPGTLETLDQRFPAHLDVLVFPSRTELAADAPGLVLVSDRIFEIFPVDEARGFHTRRFRLALLRHAVSHDVDRIEPLADRAWVADLRAQVMADLDEARRHGNAKSPAELLSFAAFHPSVDSLLYARQVPFLDVYFDQGTGPSPFLEDPDLARWPRPRAREVLGDVRASFEADARADGDDRDRNDTGAAGYEAFVAALARGREPTRDALRRGSPRAAEDLDGWLTLRRVNYRLGEVRSEVLADGRARHVVVVHRDGDPRPEPVSVVLEDAAGVRHRTVYREGGAAGEVAFFTPGDVGVARVVIDPEGRAAQDPDLTTGHPRDDDATRWPLRPPLLQAFNVSFSPSDGTVQGFVTFAVRRLFDLESIWQLTVFADPGAIGGVARYIRGIGPKRHGNARVGFAAAGVDVSRLDDGFAGAEQGGWRFGLNASAGLDRRTFLFDPRGGVNASIAGRIGGVRRDDGDLVWTGAAGGRAGYTLGIGFRNAIFFLGAAGWTFGDPLETELQRIGGIGNLRGFQLGEIVGDGRVSGLVEYRYTLLTDLSVNVLHLAWVRELQVALFGGGGALFFPTTGQDDVLGLADAGVGLRFHVDYGGVQPGVVAIDLAWPMTDTPARVGVVNGGSPTPNIYFYFNQFL